MFRKQGLINGTDIGFKQEEIRKTTTDDLLNLRTSILGYLKSKKLKKRNAKFMEVYIRINEELIHRKTHQDEVFPENDPRSFDFQGLPPKRSMSSSIPSGTSLERLDDLKEEKLLRRKSSMNSMWELEIPSFFHDKRQKTDTEQKNNDIKKKKDEIEKPAKGK